MRIEALLAVLGVQNQAKNNVSVKNSVKEVVIYYTVGHHLVYI